MGAIFRRELSSYFTSPIGYIFLSAFYACSGLFFSMTALASGSTNLSGVYSLLFFVLLVLIPILTMRTLSEDKRQKTDQLLLTSPVSLSGLVFGKFLAAFVIYLLATSITLLYAVIVASFATPDWSVILGNAVGFILLGAAYISIGIFVSSLTENQIVSAVISFVIMTILYLLTPLALLIPVDFISKAIQTLSFSDRYTPFTYGLFNLSDALFFITFSVAFMFLTVRVLEKRRWG